MQQSFINHGGLRWLWISLLLLLGSTVAYLWHAPIDGPNGGSWLGYTLGTIGAANAADVEDVFAMEDLSSGQLMAGAHEEGGCGEGKCSGDKEDGEGSCGGDEGSCGGDA